MDDGPVEEMLRKVKQLQEEAASLAGEVGRVLAEELREVSERSTCLELAARWEGMEMIVGALEVCLRIAKERDPVTIQNLSRQLKHWRRDQGKREQGWLETRTVKDTVPTSIIAGANPGSEKSMPNIMGEEIGIVNLTKKWKSSLREREKDGKEAEDWSGWCGVRRQLSRQSPRSMQGNDPA